MRGEKTSKFSASRQDDIGVIDATEEKQVMDMLNKSENEAKIFRCQKIWLGVTYMLSMGVCGTILVALGSTLNTLAANAGTSATKIGSVFIARGIGAILGAVFSAKLYLWFSGNHVLTVSLLLVTCLLLVLPYTKNLILMHIEFLFLGVGTAVTDTGCQIMTRKIHGKGAGPWLGANTVAFGIAGALVPCVELLTDSLVWQYYSLACMVAAIAVLAIFVPNPEGVLRKAGDPAAGAPKHPGGGKPNPHYRVEIVISIMVFCFIGGKVSSTAYLDSYVDSTEVISARESSWLIFVLWIAITVGRLAGVMDQFHLTNKTLPRHLTVLCVGGTLAMLLVLTGPHNADFLWIGVAFYGLFNGPCVGYCYDWNNRTTFPSEKSMAIVMFGLNFGASLVPYLTSVIWESGCGPRTLIVVILLSMLLPLPLLQLTPYLSYDPSINPRIKYTYESLPQDEPI